MVALDGAATVRRADGLVAYLGWQQMGNLGDDAIYEAVRSQVPGATFLHMPRFHDERIHAVTTGLNRRLRRSTQVVGGGTLIGASYFRGLISRGLALTRNKRS